MIEILKDIFRLIRGLIRISMSDLEKSLKNRIRKACFEVFFPKNYDSRNKISGFAGYKVKICTYKALSYLFNEIFIEQEYYFVTKNKTPYIIDCGSNIGMSVLYFKMLYPDSEILAFEPCAEAFFCLERNIRNNNLNSVLIYKKALSNKEGTIDFYYDQNDSGSLLMSTKQERMPKQKQTVEASVLSKYINRTVDFLKMDVEGAELEIMEELSHKGKLNDIKEMVIEYHHHIIRDADVFSKILRLLEDAGFGYQLESRLGRPLKHCQFQNILIYAYKKPVPNRT